MKHLTISTIFILIVTIVKSQSVIEVNTICDNNVSTYWNDPSSDNLPLLDDDNDPSTPPVPNTQDDRYLNGLDWVNGNTGGSGYSTVNMFFTQNEPYGNMTNVKPLTQPNPWYDYLYYGEELIPDNGWEMLLHNLGYFPNATDEHQFEEHKFTPYIVLYNRYTGIIRVFVTYGKNPIPDGAIDGVKIDLSFATNSQNPTDPLNVYSGLLRHGVPKDKPLDQATEVKRMSAVAKTPVLENRWYSVDFQVAYDPCTCMYPSRLSLDFNWFSETDFALNGRQLTLTEDITDPAAQELIDMDFLGSFEYNGEDAENGFIIYASLEKAVDDYIKQMEEYQTQLDAVNEYNATIKRNIAIMKAFKAVVLGGINTTGTIVAGVSIGAALIGGESWAADFSTNAADLIEADTVRFVTLTAAAKKLLGGQFDFFSNKNFKEKPKPTKPSQPVVAYSEMAFKGKLYNDLPIPGPDFMAPGTFNSTSQSNTINDPLVYKYPIYNDILGTFALMEAPKFIISRDIQNVYSKPIQYVYLNSPGAATVNADYTSWTENVQVKLASDLKFALNSSLDIKSYNIDLAIVVKDSVTGPRNTAGNDIAGYQQCFTDPEYITNLNSLPNDVDQIHEIYNYYPYENGDDFDSPPGSIAYRPIFYDPPIQVQSYKKRTRTYVSDFFPKDAFHEIVFEYGFRNDRIGTPADNSPFIPEENGFLSDITLGLKIMLDIEFYTLDETGQNNTISETFTYDIPTENNLPIVSGVFTPLTTDLFPNLSSSNYNLDYPKNLNFVDVTFDGTEVDGCEKVGNTYTCKAVENISLSGNTVAASGYEVNMIAGNEIIEYPECVITGEVVRQIIPFFDYSHPMPQMNSNDVITYCGTINEPSTYMAKFGKASDSGSGDVNPTIEPDGQNEALRVILYPNPAVNSTTLKLSREVLNVDIQVYDISGRRVDCNITSSGLAHVLDLDKLTSGLFLIKVNTDEGTITKNLIVK